MQSVPHEGEWSLGVLPANEQDDMAKVRTGHCEGTRSGNGEGTVFASRIAVETRTASAYVLRSVR